MGQSFFHFKHFSILSQSKGLKVTTDACVLGAVASQPHPAKCLDIGSGTGILSLMLAQRYTQTLVDAIEIEPVVAEQAAVNIKNSPFADRIHLACMDIFDAAGHSTYDLIISNPPYFSNHLKGEKSEKNTAIHNRYMPMNHFTETVHRLLNEQGAFWVIYPPYEMQRFRNAAQYQHLYCLEEISIYNQPEKHFRTICHFSKQQGTCQTRMLLLHHEDGSRTADFSQLMHDFYLENTDLYKKRKTN